MKRDQLRYRKYENLLADVEMDMRSISQDGNIEPGTLIKIAMKCNYELGARIRRTKETILEIEHGRAKLPEDFHIMNFALLCGEWTVEQPVPQGTNIQEVVPEYRPWPGMLECTDESLDSKPVCLSECGTRYHLVQVISTEVRHYKQLVPIRFTKSQYVDCDCPNINVISPDEAYIKDGFVFTSFDFGKLYINYDSLMFDEDGDLVVLDHPMINEYYEYALKQRILENLIMDGNTTVGPQFELVTQQLRMARNNAISIARTPDFEEMHQVWRMNRKAMYSRYYDMFKSHFAPVRFR